VPWAQEVGEGRGWKRRNQAGREAAGSVSWVKIDGHQRPWAASRLGQGIAPPRRPRSGGATAAPQIPTQRRRRPSGSTVIRKCRRCPCEAAPRCCVIVPRGDFRGKPPSLMFSSCIPFSRDTPFCSFVDWKFIRDNFRGFNNFNSFLLFLLE